MALTHVFAGSIPASRVQIRFWDVVVSFHDVSLLPASGKLIKEPSQGSAGFGEN